MNVLHNYKLPESRVCGSYFPGINQNLAQGQPCCESQSHLFGNAKPQYWKICDNIINEMCYRLMQGLRNIRILIQGQLYNNQRGLALKHDRSWSSDITSSASALQLPSEGSSDPQVGLVE